MVLNFVDWMIQHWFKVYAKYPNMLRMKEERKRELPHKHTYINALFVYAQRTLPMTFLL